MVIYALKMSREIWSSISWLQVTIKRMLFGPIVSTCNCELIEFTELSKHSPKWSYERWVWLQLFLPKRNKVSPKLYTKGKNGVILTWKVESVVKLKFNTGFQVIGEYIYAENIWVNLIQIFSNYSKSRVVS